MSLVQRCPYFRVSFNGGSTVHICILHSCLNYHKLNRDNWGIPVQACPRKYSQFNRLRHWIITLIKHGHYVYLSNVNTILEVHPPLYFLFQVRNDKTCAQPRFYLFFKVCRAISMISFTCVFMLI